MPALGSPALAERLGDDPFPVIMEDGDSFTARIVAVRTWTPALGADDFLVVDGSALRAGLRPPTGLLVTGDHPDAAALKKAAGGDAQVRLRSAVIDATVERPLQTGAERVYVAAVAAGAAHAAGTRPAATLLRAAPERAALLARLRTMGLTRAQGRRLLILESLPQALLAAVGGVLTAWAAIRLPAPASPGPPSPSPPGRRPRTRPAARRPALPAGAGAGGGGRPDRRRRGGPARRTVEGAVRELLVHAMTASAPPVPVPVPVTASVTRRPLPAGGSR
ncbi:hypothetical protein SALBM217S_04902 [Streptomyces griseoloalbus]